MAARNDSGGNDRDGADAVVLELLVLDRLLYRNRSQHRSAKYFALVVEVRRACKTFAAPKLPDLLAQGLGLIASVPDSRNSRTREAWVRSAAAGLSRMRVAAIACAYSLESIVKASKHLAHQVSQTYFMALSTVLMACLARLFACNLHLGGRLLQVHAALLRTLLAQLCTSECLSASDMAECRVPEDTASFLTRLRGAGGAHRATRTKPTRDSTSTAAAAAAIASGSRGSKDTAEPPAPLPTTPKPSSQAQGGEEGTGVDDDDGDEDEDEDDTGEHIGRAPTAAEAAAGEEAEMDRAVAHPAEINALQRTTRLGRAGATAAAAESQGGGGGGGGGGQARTTARGSAGADGRASGARRAGGGSGDSGRGAGKKGVGQARKKVVLASEFSDSSSEEESDTEYTAATAVSSTSDSAHKRGREGPTPPQPPADKPPVSADQAAAAAAAAVSDTSPERPAVRRHQPSLFFSSAPRGPQQPRSKPNGRRTSDPVAAVASSASPASRSGGTSGGNDIAASASWPTVARETPEHACVVAAPVPGQSGRVGWTIDPTPTPRPTPEPAVDAPPSSGRKREGKKSGRRRGGGDRPAGAAPAVAVVEGLEVNAPDDGFREGVTPSVSATPELNTDTGGGTSVAVDAGEAGAPATSGGGGRTATGTTGVSAPPPAETLHRKSRGKLEGTKARRRLPSDPKILGPESLGGVGEQEQESSRAGGGAAGAEPPRRDGIPITAGGKPHAPGKSVKSEGGAGAGTKRGSSGRKLEEKSRKAKKQKTKKKKNAGGGPSPSTTGGTGKRGGGGGRNAIDDIFGSLL